MRAYFGRRYRLSASHRLHTEALSAEQNRAVYGKCNNPHGHGHNYVVEVVVGGEVAPETGMVCNLVALDACVQREVLEPFDHTNLNLQPCFAQVVPSTENLCIEVRRRLKRAFNETSLGAELVAVRVEETSNNSFEIQESGFARKETRLA
jgi:6-pyruvoyltetrahydropterin/6-carboxytetrahydropterin synthase